MLDARDAYLKANAKPKMAVEFNGKTYGSKSALGDAMVDAAGDREPIAWEFGGETYIRRRQIASAIEEAVVDAGATDTVREVGKIGAFTITVEGQRDKFGARYFDIVAEANGRRADATHSPMEKADGRTQAEGVIRTVERLLANLPNNLEWARGDLRSAKKVLAELDKTSMPDVWPDQAKLDKARADHKEVLNRLAGKKEEGAAPTPDAADVRFSRGAGQGITKKAATQVVDAIRILAELAPGAQVKKITNIPGRVQFNITLPDQSTARVMQRPHNPYGETVYGFDLDENGEMMNMQVGRPGENPEDVGAVDDVWIDVSLLNPGSKFGEIMYSAAANYAHNTGRIFIGDPAGLSDEALRRRTEQMISSALKFGTTEHLAPHPRQTVGSEKLGVPALKWVYGDHVGNIERMIDVSLRSLENAGLDLGKVAYDPQRETFIDTATGVPVPRGTQLAALANANGMGGRGSERPAGGGAVRQRGAGQGQAGWRTVARAALFGYLKSTISVESGAQQRGGLLDRLRDVSTGLGRKPSAGGDYPASQRIF